MRIFIELLPHKETQKTADAYRVTTEDGEELVDRTRYPFGDGARALKTRGFSGPLEMWDRQRPFARMRGDIATAAGRWLSELATGPSTFRVSKTAPKAFEGPAKVA